MQKHERNLSFDESSTTAQDEDHDMAYASTEVDTDEENTDELYLINADPLTTHVTFLMPGQATATAIRHFLEISLTAWQVIHEDDQVLTTAGVTDNDLPKLQVKIWTTTHELPVNFDAIVPAASFGMTYSISQLKLQIINRLSMNHVFVHLPNKLYPCSLSLCPYKEVPTREIPFLFGIEPLVHWGTLTPAHEINILDGRVLVFRRVGVKCDDMHWVQLTRKFVSEDRLVYCQKCLEWIMNHELPAPAEVELMIKNDDHQNDEEDAKAEEWRIPKDSGSGSEEGSDEQASVYCQAALQTDGANDLVDPNFATTLSTYMAKPEHVKPKFRNVADIVQHFKSNTQASNGTMTSCTVSTNNTGNPFTGPSHKSASPPVTDSGGCLGVNHQAAQTSRCSTNKLSSASQQKVPSSLPTSTSTTIVKRVSPRTKKFADYKTPQGHRITKRGFGREISSNVMVKKPTQEPLSKVGFQAVNPTPKNALCSSKLTLPRIAGLAKMFLQRKQTKEALERNIKIPDTKDDDESDWQTITNSPCSSSPQDCSQVNSPQSSTPIPTPPQTTVPPAREPLALKELNSPTTTPNPQTHFFARYATSPPEVIPDNVTREAYLAHLQRVPKQKEKICICAQPANTSAVKIAQCANISCRYIWFHYNCLDKPCKISARFGTMVCQVCKNDDLFKDLPKGVGQEAMDLEKLGEEVAIAVSYAGPGIVNPYGIMLGDEDYVGETEMKCRAKREKDREARKMNWGKMKYCGYAESRPYALVEAYANEGRRLAQDEE